MSNDVWALLKREAESRMPGETIECTLLGRPPVRVSGRRVEHYVPSYIRTMALTHGLEVVFASEDRYFFHVIRVK